MIDRCLAAGRDDEGLDPRTRIVRLLLDEPWVNHVDDPVDRDARLGNVGRENNLVIGQHEERIFKKEYSKNAEIQHSK